MQQEAAQELIGTQAHQLLLVAMCRVAPAEVDLVIDQSNESVVRDGDSMRIGAEIAVLHGKFTGSGFLSEPKRRLSQENPWAPERSLAAQPAIAARAE